MTTANCAKVASMHLNTATPGFGGGAPLKCVVRWIGADSCTDVQELILLSNWQRTGNHGTEDRGGAFISTDINEDWPSSSNYMVMDHVREASR
jgi:hypothetical protein